MFSLYLKKIASRTKQALETNLILFFQQEQQHDGFIQRAFFVFEKMFNSNQHRIRMNLYRYGFLYIKIGHRKYLARLLIILFVNEDYEILIYVSSLKMLHSWNEQKKKINIKCYDTWMFLLSVFFIERVPVVLLFTLYFLLCTFFIWIIICWFLRF